MGRREFDDTGLAFTQIVKDCRFLTGVDWRSPQYLALRLGPFQPGLDPLADHCPLELREDTHHLEQRLARRGRGVHALLVKVQVDPESVKLSLAARLRACLDGPLTSRLQRAWTAPSMRNRGNDLVGPGGPGRVERRDH